MNKKSLENLSAEEWEKYSEMALSRPIEAIKGLKDLTDCSLGEGKMWVDHIRGKWADEYRQKYIEPLLPCPYCGEKLRTPLAKQCRFCLRDWHNENELKWLVKSK